MQRLHKEFVIDGSSCYYNFQYDHILSVITSQQQADTKEEARSTKVFVNVDYPDYGTYNVKIWVTSLYGYDYKILTAVVDKYYYEIKHPPGPAKTGPFFVGNNLSVGEHFQACI